MPKAKRKRGNQGTKKRRTYKDIVCAFDIETTRLNDINSIMYIWMFQGGSDHTVTGRTWKECERFFRRLADTCEDNEWIVIYVHNLSFEFQYLRNIYHFTADEVFATGPRRVLKCDMYDHLEFRCSYLHSNMSLAEYTSKMGAQHSKLSGAEFNYDIMRYPWTKLSDREMEYCLNDVRGLVEAITIEMQHDQDNLYSIPLTSTGYVRRDVKKAMKEVSFGFIRTQLPDWQTYVMLREAFRGGNTHANRHYSGQILRNVHSADESSAYPSAECNNRFPVSAFRHYKGATIEDLKRLVFVRKRAVLVRMCFWGIRLQDPHWGCPYIPIDKCRNTVNPVLDNGRILRADYLEITLTDIDLKIILAEYSAESMDAGTVLHARYGWLPDPLVRCIITYFRKKTELKGVPDQEIFYMKNKAKLNSIYGMSAQNPVRVSQIFDDASPESFVDSMDDPKEILEENNRRAFFPYQWGVWCTAIARYRLEEGIRLAHQEGCEFVYCDTDSVKYLGEIDWDEYNKDRILDSEDSGAWADDPKGRRHYMGVFEYEGCYEEFATRGAKKYAYVEDGRLHITIAGVNKKAGAKELEDAGGIRAFLQDQFVFTADENESVYVDHLREIRHIDGHRIRLGPCVTIRPSMKTLSDTEEYSELLKDPDAFSKFLLDKQVIGW